MGRAQRIAVITAGMECGHFAGCQVQYRIRSGLHTKHQALRDVVLPLPPYMLLKVVTFNLSTGPSFPGYIRQKFVSQTTVIMFANIERLSAIASRPALPTTPRTPCWHKS
jgi:hypothetical protein